MKVAAILIIIIVDFKNYYNYFLNGPMLFRMGSERTKQ
jgi:hypothetical protein